MAFDVTFNLVDGYNRRGAKRFEGTDALLADAIVSEGLLFTDLAAVSEMGRYSTVYSVQAVETDAAVAGANIDAGGTLHVRLDDGQVYSLKIPAIRPALVNADGTIDITNAAVTNFVGNFEAAGKFRLGRGRYVVAILSGELDR